MMTNKRGFWVERGTSWDNDGGMICLLWNEDMKISSYRRLQ